MLNFIHFLFVELKMCKYKINQRIIFLYFKNLEKAQKNTNLFSLINIKYIYYISRTF